MEVDLLIKTGHTSHFVTGILKKVTVPRHNKPTANKNVIS